jgi:hypothetical protein
VLDEIVRGAARQMVAVALQAEVSAYIDAHAEEVDENGYLLVVRKRSSQRTRGDHGGRSGAGAGAAGQRQARRSGHWGAQTVRFGDPAPRGHEVAAGGRGAAAAVPARPVQLGFGPALTQYLGTGHGLSAITRLTKDWQDEATTFNKRSLAGTDYVYRWVDGIHLKVRLEQDQVCLLG